MVASQAMHRGKRKRDNPADRPVCQILILSEPRFALPRQVSALVNNAAPLLSSFPEPVVRSVGAKHQQQCQGGANQRMGRLWNRNPMESAWESVMQNNDDSRPCDTQGNAPQDLANHRTFDVEQVAGPFVRIIGGHRITVESGEWECRATASFRRINSIELLKLDSRLQIFRGVDQVKHLRKKGKFHLIQVFLQVQR